MNRSIHLPLYGHLEHGPEDNMAWDIYQTSALSRLRDVSLSSVPSRFVAQSSAASRFEHSVGVGHLAHILADNLDLNKDLLIVAALCHDIGSPPFSHISEIFMYDKIGQTHEEKTEQILLSGGDLEQVLDDYNVSPQDVLDIICGNDALLSPFVAGSFDIDNIDNSLHLLVSLGFIEDIHYDPRELVNAFTLHEGRAALKTESLEQILAWQTARRRLYNILQRDYNLASATMLYRAIEFAYEGNYLNDDFFVMEEGEALDLLRKRAGGETSHLLDLLCRWRQYHVIAERTAPPEAIISLASDWKAHKLFCDEIAKRHNIPLVDIALYAGQDRAEKSINLPFVGPHKEEISSLLSGATSQPRLAVVINKRHLDQSASINNTLDQMLAEVPIKQTGHIFF